MTTPDDGARLPAFRRPNGSQPAPAPAPPAPPAPAPSPAPAPPANNPPTAPPPPGLQQPAATRTTSPVTGQPGPAQQPTADTKAPTEMSDWIILGTGVVLPWCCFLFLGFIPSGGAAIWAWVKMQEHKKANQQSPLLLVVSFWVSLVVMVPIGLLSTIWFFAYALLGD